MSARRIGLEFSSKQFTASISVVGITPRQFEQMKSRLGGARRSPSPLLAPALPAHVRTREILLGIDPSLRGTGYGLIRCAKPFAELLAQGTISCPAAWPHSRCLAQIARAVREVLKQYHPTVCVVEGLFYAQNLKTALVMGEARGAALATVAEAGVEIYELAPRKVKQAIVGYGAAQKLAVARMVQRMLRLTEVPAPDAADALALALAHAQENGRFGLSATRKV